MPEGSPLAERNVGKKLLYWADRLFALTDGCKPYMVDPLSLGAQKKSERGGGKPLFADGTALLPSTLHSLDLAVAWPPAWHDATGWRWSSMDWMVGSACARFAGVFRVAIISTNRVLADKIKIILVTACFV